eukprot:TRINITY_DN1252_c0_g1_i1.p2 TRINITY_DN1252_c0_g1~~TRINITY_DN1252_c0_g1_i1.p2  ORF type:complete len:106 (-),score=28.09 TRINITY_DN1252_c0_g1_i1:489-806(-)
MKELEELKAETSSKSAQMEAQTSLAETTQEKLTNDIAQLETRAEEAQTKLLANEKLLQGKDSQISVAQEETKNARQETEIAQVEIEKANEEVQKAREETKILKRP